MKWLGYNTGTKQVRVSLNTYLVGGDGYGIFPRNGDGARMGWEFYAGVGVEVSSSAPALLAIPTSKGILETQLLVTLWSND